MSVSVVVCRITRYFRSQLAAPRPEPKFQDSNSRLPLPRPNFRDSLGSALCLPRGARATSFCVKKLLLPSVWSSGAVGWMDGTREGEDCL